MATPCECYCSHRESTDSQTDYSLYQPKDAESNDMSLTRKGKKPQAKQMPGQKAGVFTCALPSGPGNLFQPTAGFSHSLFHLHTELLVPSSHANIPAVPFGRLPVLSPGLERDREYLTLLCFLVGTPFVEINLQG